MTLSARTESVGEDRGREIAGEVIWSIDCKESYESCQFKIPSFAPSLTVKRSQSDRPEALPKIGSALALFDLLRSSPQSISHQHCAIISQNCLANIIGHRGRLDLPQNSHQRPNIFVKTLSSRAGLQRSLFMQAAKRMKMTGPLIGTHNGHFHADEALAVYLLRLLPTYKDSGLVRTRDPEKLKECHTVVDVGGVYDDGQRRYDHHQREFTTTFPHHKTKLSSAGLVYMHYGKDIISYCTGLDKSYPDVTLLYDKLYDNFVEAFDANDNGVSAIDSSDLRKAGLERKFEDRGFSIASVVNRINYSHPVPAHLAKDSISANGQNPNQAASEAALSGDKEKSTDEKQADEDERFLKASHFVGEQFLSELMDKFHSWLPARTSVKEAFGKRSQHDPKGRIMVLSEGMPWADHLYDLEKESGVSGQVLYVLFPEGTEPNSKWRIRAVGIEDGGFENRKSLPEAWRGVRDEELSKVSGVPGGVFVHAGGFIGGNKTFDGALAMAQKAVDM